MGIQTATVLYFLVMVAVIVHGRCALLSTGVLGAARGEYRHRVDLRCVLLPIPETSM